MFLVQYNRNKLHHLVSFLTPLLLLFLPESSLYYIIKKVETKFKLQTQAVLDLGELLCLKS